MLAIEGEVGPVKERPPTKGSSRGDACATRAGAKAKQAATAATATPETLNVAGARATAPPRPSTKRMSGRDVIRRPPGRQCLDAAISAWLTSPSHGALDDAADSLAPRLDPVHAHA